MEKITDLGKEKEKRKKMDLEETKKRKQALEYEGNFVISSKRFCIKKLKWVG